MIRHRKAFTLMELLVVIAIVAILSAILFPVFARAKIAARRAVCVSNFHQTQLAVALYLGDYDDRFMPVNLQPAGPFSSRTDRTWVQMILPYARSFSIFRCPEDRRGDQVADRTFDQDLVPGDTFSQYYTASQFVNTGYNYLILAPVSLIDRRWTATPYSMDSFGDQSRTILFVDSIGARDENGSPMGGGSWLVAPPCRYAVGANGDLIDSFRLPPNAQPRVFGGNSGWATSDNTSPFRYGGAWAWHREFATVVRLDGSVRPATMAGLSAGCDVKPNWGGTIQDSASYLWWLQ